MRGGRRTPLGTSGTFLHHRASRRRSSHLAATRHISLPPLLLYIVSSLDSFVMDALTEVAEIHFPKLRALEISQNKASFVVKSKTAHFAVTQFPNHNP